MTEGLVTFHHEGSASSASRSSSAALGSPFLAGGVRLVGSRTKTISAVRSFDMLWPSVASDASASKARSEVSNRPPHSVFSQHE